MHRVFFRAVFAAAGIVAVLVLVLVLFPFLGQQVLLSREGFRIVTELPAVEENDDDDQLVFVTSHYQEDLGWLARADAPVVVCSKTLPSPLCEQAGMNKGREVTSYLKFIVDNYDRLPAHVAFLHGHETSWHHRLAARTDSGADVTDLVYLAKNFADYRNHGYVSLNNTRFDGAVHADGTRYLREVLWEPLFRPFLRRDPPERLLHDCCAQFVVSRERIRRLPRAAYERWYDYIMHEDPVGDGGFKVGLAFEYVWHVIFGEPDVTTADDQRRMFRPECRVNV